MCTILNSITEFINKFIFEIKNIMVIKPDWFSFCCLQQKFSQKMQLFDFWLFCSKITGKDAIFKIFLCHFAAKVQSKDTIVWQHGPTTRKHLQRNLQGHRHWRGRTDKDPGIDQNGACHRDSWVREVYSRNSRLQETAAWRSSLITKRFVLILQSLSISTTNWAT